MRQKRDGTDSEGADEESRPDRKEGNRLYVAAPAGRQARRAGPEGPCTHAAGLLQHLQGVEEAWRVALPRLLPAHAVKQQAGSAAVVKAPLILAVVVLLLLVLNTILICAACRRFSRSSLPTIAAAMIQLAPAWGQHCEDGWGGVEGGAVGVGDQREPEQRKGV